MATTFSSKLSSDGDSIKDNRPNIGIKGGYDFGVARAYGGYFYHAKAKDSDRGSINGVTGSLDTEWTNHKFVIGGDYTPAITDNFKLIAGLYTGISVMNFKSRLNTNVVRASYDVTKSGWLLGTRLGAEYSFDEHNALEFGVKIDRSWYNIDDIDNVKATDMGAYLGYTYKF